MELPSKLFHWIGLGLCIFVAMFWSLIHRDQDHDILLSEAKSYNPCCDYPCLNLGICMNLQNHTYYCDCTGTGFYGLDCEIPTWSVRLKLYLKPSPEFAHNLLTTDTLLMKIVNKIRPLQQLLMKYVYMTRGTIVDQPPLFESDHEYVTLDAYFNETYFSRTLPPVPRDCPTPMGSKGPKKLVEPSEIFERVFRRREFKPEPHGTNLLFQYYAQHFTHQFFRTNYATHGKMTKGTGGVDVSNIYGLTESMRQGLRSKKDGKLLTQIIDGEEYPPYLKDVTGVPMDYPPHLPIPEESKFALGHSFFALLPGLFVYSTIWIREHNRICDVLKEEHPHWDDERLYHTSRLIVLGSMIRITIEDYVKHLSQYKLDLTFDPELIHGTTFQFDNRIHVEFDQLYHWHALVPDGIQVQDQYYELMDMAYTSKAVFKHGFENFVKALAENRAGAMVARNHPAVVEPVFSKALNNSRYVRLPGFNQYRKRFGMNPYETFEQLTGEKEIAKELEKIYGHVDAVEFYVGLICETQNDRPAVTGITMVNTGGPWAIKGLMSNPICSPKWWRPSTFGGPVGFSIIKEASFKNLFCKNIKGDCSHIKFTVPEAPTT